MRYILCLLLSISLPAYSQIDIYWQKKASLPATPRGDCGAFVIDSDYYIVGGGDSIANTFNAVWRYSIASDHWQRMGDFPGGPIREPNCFAIDGKGYLIAGIDSISNYECDDKVWEYTPTTDTWTRKSDFPGGIRQGGTTFSYNHHGYYALGRWCGVSHPSDIWEYDPSNDNWVNLPDTLPAKGRYGCINAGTDSIIYIAGGSPATSNTPLNDIWEYNAASQKWTFLNSILGGERYLCMLYPMKNKFLLGYGAYEFGFRSDLYLYDVPSQVWSTVTSHGFPDSIAGYLGTCFTYGNQFYFAGGFKDFDFGMYNDLWTFDATPLLTTGISETAHGAHISVSPNPVSALGTLTVSVPEEGEVRFTDGLGRLLYTSYLRSGVNTIPCDELHVQDGIVFFSAQLRHGTANGKVVIVR